MKEAGDVGDELFVVLDRHLRIEVEDHEPVDPEPRQAYLIPKGVPKGVQHRPVIEVGLVTDPGGVEPHTGITLRTPSLTGLARRNGAVPAVQAMTGTFLCSWGVWGP